MPVGEDAFLGVPREVALQPVQLGRAGLHRLLRVERDEVPVALFEAVVRLPVRGSQLAEVLLVSRGGPGRVVVLVVAGRRSGLRLEPAPGSAVVPLEVGDLPVVVLVVAHRQHVRRVDRLDQPGGSFVLAVGPVAGRAGTRDVAGGRDREGGRAAVRDQVDQRVVDGEVDPQDAVVLPGLGGQGLADRLRDRLAQRAPPRPVRRVADLEHHVAGVEVVGEPLVLGEEGGVAAVQLVVADEEDVPAVRRRQVRLLEVFQDQPVRRVVPLDALLPGLRLRVGHRRLSVGVAGLVDPLGIDSQADHARVVLVAVQDQVDQGRDVGVTWFDLQRDLDPGVVEVVQDRLVLVRGLELVERSISATAGLRELQDHALVGEVHLTDQPDVRRRSGTGEVAGHGVHRRGPLRRARERDLRAVTDAVGRGAHARPLQPGGRGAAGGAEYL